jgi:hypothetical protein
MNTETLKSTKIGRIALDMKNGSKVARIQFNKIARYKNLTAQEGAVHKLCDDIYAGLKKKPGGHNLSIFQRLMNWI